MILPDVNVLIYAFRRDLPQRRVCRPWLAATVSGDARFGLSRMVLKAVVRITTNTRAFRAPSAIEEAFGFCEASIPTREGLGSLMRGFAALAITSKGRSASSPPASWPTL
jgi:predicted nucleic acid-binding protein